MPLRLLRSQTTSTWTEGAIEGTKRCYNILLLFITALSPILCPPVRRLEDLREESAR